MEAIGLSTVQQIVINNMKASQMPKMLWFWWQETISRKWVTAGNVQATNFIYLFEFLVKCSQNVETAGVRNWHYRFFGIYLMDLWTSYTSTSSQIILQGNKFYLPHSVTNSGKLLICVINHTYILSTMSTSSTVIHMFSNWCRL